MRRSRLREKALKAIDKKAVYGPDINISDYKLDEIGPIKNEELNDLPSNILKEASIVGMDIEERNTGGTYFQIDYEVVRKAVTNRLRKKGVIVTSIIEALEKYDWARNYYWKAIKVDMDKYTAIAELYLRHGYFIYVPPGVKIREPIQACLFVSCSNILQPVHNIIIVDEGAELNLITGCITTARRGLHVGISEFYIRRSAKLSFIMIHGWSSDFNVRPRTTAIVEENGEFVSYYINLRHVRTLQAEPKIVLEKNATAYLTNILIGKNNAFLDVGGIIEFKGEKSRGEIVSRSIIDDDSTIIMRGLLKARADKVKGHLECKGLILSDKAHGQAIPFLDSTSSNAELTHEAALGKISEEELFYLMARGFNEEEAISLIVRGFIDVGLHNIPNNIRPIMKPILDLISRLAKG